MTQKPQRKYARTKEGNPLFDSRRASEVFASIPSEQFARYATCESVAVTGDAEVVDGDNDELQLRERVSQKGLVCAIMANPKYEAA